MNNNQLPKDYFEELDWSMFMEAIGQHLSHRNYSYSNSDLLSKSTIAIGASLTVQEQDKLINWASDLIDSGYRLWFIKRLKLVGKERFIKAANSARKYDGKSRQKVFSYLLK